LTTPCTGLEARRPCSPSHLLCRYNKPQPAAQPRCCCSPCPPGGPQQQHAQSPLQHRKHKLGQAQLGWHGEALHLRLQGRQRCIGTCGRRGGGTRMGGQIETGTWSAPVRVMGARCAGSAFKLATGLTCMQQPSSSWQGRQETAHTPPLGLAHMPALPRARSSDTGVATQPLASQHASTPASAPLLAPTPRRSPPGLTPCGSHLLGWR
jgi:hypothetical protein